MSVELKVPQLGESITEAVVGKWHKKPGDAVAADEPIVVLETDKVTVDVQAPAAGALSAIVFPEGAKVKIGDVLGTIAEGAAGTKGNGKAAALKDQPPPAGPPEPGQAQGAGWHAPPPVRIEPVEARGPLSPAATPVARKVAEDKGLPLTSIQGTGVGGRVLKDDVVRATQAPAQTRPATPLPPPAPLPRDAQGREERVRMTPLRKRVAERLLAAQSQAAILTTFNEVDMSGVMNLRKAWGERFLARHNVKLGFMGFFVKAAVEALKEFPAVNASIDGEEVVFHRFYDVGVAVSGSRGLVVPVVRDADQKSLAELEKTIAELGTRARADKLTLPELQGGTFTISNGGIFGSMLSTPILNPPQTGILGMHNIVERPVVRDGQIVIRPVMYLALSYDHRLIDGREAVQFLVRIKECIETPERMLLEA